MFIAEFDVETWLIANENRCRYNLAETCVHSLTLSEVMAMAGQTPADLAALWDRPMTYGAIPGTEALRAGIAGLFQTPTAEDVLVTHGAIGANALVWSALVEPGDHVVSIVPTYQQHTAMPEALGASLTRVTLRASDNWLPDLDVLRKAMTPGTRVLALTNPNNPTGSRIPDEMLVEIARIAEAAGAWILVDEVYRGTDQDGPGSGASIFDISERGISTGSMSKAFSLAGLRVGWVVACPEVLRAVSRQRDYTTISIGQVDMHFAEMALAQSQRILARSREITRGNLTMLDNWIQAEPRLSWIRPQAGTTALVGYEMDLPSTEFCRRILDETGVLFTPGSALEIEGHIRIGFANRPESVAAGLPKVSAWMAAQG